MRPESANPSISARIATTTNRSGGRRWVPLRRLSVNITPAERAGRVLIGGAGALAGVLLVTSAGSALAIVLEVLLMVAGLDLVITGAVGHCPLYQRLGYIPASLRRPT